MASKSVRSLRCSNSTKPRRAFWIVGTSVPYKPVSPDPDADYAKDFTLDLSNMAPQVAAPHSFGNVLPIEDLSGVRIDQACVGSCANGRFEDIEMTAKILKGRKVSKGVRLLVSPASWDIYRMCLDAGLPQIIIDAGAQFVNPGCGVCTSKGAYLAPGEVCITATTRNYRVAWGAPKPRSISQVRQP